MAKRLFLKFTAKRKVTRQEKKKYRDYEQKEEKKSERAATPLRIHGDSLEKDSAGGCARGTKVSIDSDSAS